MTDFTTLVFTPAGFPDPVTAISAARARGVGILNAELCTDLASIAAGLEKLASNAGGGEFGIKLDRYSEPAAALVRTYAERGMKWLIVEAPVLAQYERVIAEARTARVRVLVEVVSADCAETMEAAAIDGVLIKGNEAGGFVGEESSFILLQKWLKATRLPLYVRGGLTPHVAAACAAMGIAGGVLDAQLLLMSDMRLPEALRRVLANLTGSETVAVGDPEHGQYFRMLVRPAMTAAKAFIAEAEGASQEELRSRVADRARWDDLARAVLPIGQDVAFAASFAHHYGSVASVLRAIAGAVAAHPQAARQQRSLTEHSPLARALGIRLPIIQGPMTRVSDTAGFASVVAEAGALPMVALAVMKGPPLQRLLEECTSALGTRPWGIGLLGFAPQELLDEQLACVARFKPSYAIIAGGRPDQALELERGGIPSFLHVPAANLIPLFLQDGARRFIFEGRECGGHIGPLSSFVLWSSMIDRLLVELPRCRVPAEQIDVVFAGGIHDAVSAAMLQIMAAPLVAAGVRIGILMGSAYLFTREIVASGAIVEQFQQEVIDCEHTVNLESGVGHASRCAYSPFARDFFQKRAALRREGRPADEARHLLDELILGRLRIASKGVKRGADSSALEAMSADRQHAEGMYMLGQVATLRHDVTDIDTLHREVTAGAAALIEARVESSESAQTTQAPEPADIAVVGMACALPKATTPQEYWDNIVAKVDAITEIPATRWDWRLYFDADRNAKDKVYSKWGGFLDDIPFDPIAYGMPPKSIESVDPMQLMGLEIAHRTLVDAGYGTRSFDRERASVVLGVSGGIGDVGMQYGLRSELPRFGGSLPDEIGARLPSWTEDSFAGILPNVAAGRIANRLNFGGMNVTTDAACASSLAAIYQAVNELTAGRSDFVIAGGLDTVQGPFGYLCFSKTQALSPRGKCSTFDASGDGIVISEGIAMLALKRLADAERDGDRIYCVIKGVGASSDGSAKGLTAPLPAGQLRAMRRAYAMAGFDPSSVGLFEAHGTGTVAGDSAELDSTTQLIKEHPHAARQAVIGSVKTMIGHTKATAGAAGLMKAVMALHRQVLPPHNNVAQPIDALANPAAPLYLLQDAMPWLHPMAHPRRAACSAFGFGGTNFHLVLEEYTGEYRPWLAPSAADAWSAELLVWSAPDADELAAQVQTFLAASQDFEEVLLRDLAASLARRFRSGEHTLGIVARNLADLRAKLTHALTCLRQPTQTLPPGICIGRGGAMAGAVAVLFSGQGSQYPNMAREAALHFPQVRKALARADDTLAAEFATRHGTGHTLSRFIFPRGCYDDAGQARARSELASTDVAQPALGAVETGLYRLLQSLGLQPDMLAGHSYGEFVALHAAGAFDFESLLKISAARGRFIIDAASAQGAELGTMAAVGAARAVVEGAIAGIDGLVIANHNSPNQTVISGKRASVQAAVAKLRESAVEATEIPVAAAFHSALVQPAQRLLGELIEATDWAQSRIPVYSNTTGRPHSSDVSAVKRAMTDHLVQPVEFVAEIEAMYADGARIFVEVGPKSVLTRLTDRILGERTHTSIAVDDGTGLSGLLAGIGQLLCAGIALDVERLFAGRDCRIGDPLQPASLVRRAPPSKHAWLLNGSAARRAGTPAAAVGVTAAEAAARAASGTPAATVASAATVTSGAAGATVGGVTPPSGASAAPRPAGERPPASIRPSLGRSTASALTGRPHATPTNISRNVRRKDQPMDDRSNQDVNVLAEYFATMRQFLETQERVMDAFLATDGMSRPALRSRPPAINATRMAELAAAPIITPAARAYVPLPSASAPPPPPMAQPVAPPAAPAVAAAPAPAPKVNGTATNGAGHHSIHAAAAGTNGASASRTGANGASANGSGHAVASAPAEMDRDKMTNALLGIVEEKTGYPRDMLGLDQNLEADLGIDSIKRVEVVGAFLKLLPERVREALATSGAKLSSKSTLNGMLDLLTQTKTGGQVSGPFDSAGMGVEVDVVGHPSRLIMRAERQALAADLGRQLASGRFIVTCDHRGVAARVAGLLTERGLDVTLVQREVLADESRLGALCETLRAEPIGAIVHLAPLGEAPLSAQAGPAEWRAALQVNEKSFFILLRELQASLASAGHVIAASGLGGLFGRDATSRGELYLQGGAPGLLKSLLQERADLRVKAIDLDPSRDAGELAAALLGEMELQGGRQEVGYPGGERTIFRTVEASIAPATANDALPGNLVVLATGGLRGITAETLRELARPGNTLILAGRSALTESEAAETAALADADALRRHYVAEVRSGRMKMTPADIQRRVQSVMGAREMRANLADFRAAGADAYYCSVDVNDEQALGALIREIEGRHQRIDGVVHGAGVIEDKLVVDKTSESWSRVVETKVVGLLLLQKLLNPANLKFLMVFSSVAGRYGNSGQSDYATANELMNRICVALKARWGSDVAVGALCWGPWGPTKFGSGMVTAETEAKFKARGVSLVSAALGRELFREQLARRDDAAVEIICGAGPWEEEESRRGAFSAGRTDSPTTRGGSEKANAPAAATAPAATAPAATAPAAASAAAETITQAGAESPAASTAQHTNLLDGAIVSTAASGGKTLSVKLDAALLALLDGGTGESPTLTPGAALELMAQAAQQVWPRWRVAEAREFRLARELRPGSVPPTLHIRLAPPPYGSSSGFDVSASLESDADAGRELAQCVLGLQLVPPTAPIHERTNFGARPAAASKAHSEWATHEGRAQIIEKIDGLSANGAGASVRAARPGHRRAHSRDDTARWLFDPTLMKAAAQLTSLWTRQYLGERVTARRFGRVARYCEQLPARLRIEFKRTESPDRELVRGDVVFFDEEGATLLLIEELDCALSAAADGATRRASVAAEGALT